MASEVHNFDIAILKDIVDILSGLGFWCTQHVNESRVLK